MTRQKCAGLVLSLSIASATLLQAQSGEWTTSGFDAQRTAWLRNDDRLTKDAIVSGNFKFLWKTTFDNESRQLNSLTPPVLLDRLIGYRGFKALAFLGGSADRVFAIDTDLARPYWTTHLNYSAATGGQPPSSWECPGGLTAVPSRRTVLTPTTFARGGGGGRGARSGSAVGEPGRGAAILSAAPRGRGPATAPAPPAPGGAGRAGGRAAVPPVPFGGVDPVYVVGSDGFLHTLRASNGSDATPPVPFLPPNANPSALIFIDGVVYTTTSNGCGAAPNAVWAIDTTTPENKVAMWKTGGANIAGTAGPVFGSDGTLYVAIGASTAQGARGSTPTPGPGGIDANAVIALDRDTLTPKDWFSAPGVDFNASPVVFRFQGREIVAVTANDGRLYLLDSASLGGADHKTPLHVTGKYTAAGAGAGLATWEDATTRWILAPVAGAVPATMKFAANGPAPHGGVVAFKVVDRSGTVALEPSWSSRNVVSPTAPTVVNGIVFVAASGEYRGTGAVSAATRVARSTPGVLYALDGTTGKELWGSGTTIGSFVRGGIVASAGQVYLVTYDNRLYTFGVPMEH